MIININPLNNIILSFCLVNSIFNCKFNEKKIYFIDNDNQFCSMNEE